MDTIYEENSGKGNNTKNMQELWFLDMILFLMKLYKGVKLYNKISKGFEIIQPTQFVRENNKWEISRKARVMVPAHDTSSDEALQN